MPSIIEGAGSYRPRVGANEMTPGMNTQAKKPAFDPKGDIMPMDQAGPQIPAAPVQKPKSIREYLNTLEAGQVPTFTNIPGQEGQFGAPNAMVFKDIGQSPGGPITPYGPGEAGPGAIPEPGAGGAGDISKATGDPYADSLSRLPDLLPDIERQVKEELSAKYGNSLGLEQYQKAMAIGVNKVMNETIKHYEKEAERLQKERMTLITKNYSAASIKEYQRTKDISVLQKSIDIQGISQKAKKDYEKYKTQAATGEFSPEGKAARAFLAEYPDVNSLATDRINELRKTLDTELKFQTQKDRSKRGAGEPNLSGFAGGPHGASGSPTAAPEVNPVQGAATKRIRTPIEEKRLSKFAELRNRGVPEMNAKQVVAELEASGQL